MAKATGVNRTGKTTRGGKGAKAQARPAAAKPQMRIAEEFVYALADVYSESVLDQIRNALRLLANAPLMGTTVVRSSLARRYNGSVRILPVLTLSIVYRFDAAENVIEVLTLIYGTGN